MVSYYLLTRKQLKQTDSAVIVNALKGEEDYVPAPSMLETIKSKEGSNIFNHTISKIDHLSSLQQAIYISWAGE